LFHDLRTHFDRGRVACLPGRVDPHGTAANGPRAFQSYLSEQDVPLTVEPAEDPPEQADVAFQPDILTDQSKDPELPDILISKELL